MNSALVVARERFAAVEIQEMVLVASVADKLGLIPCCAYSIA